MRCIQCSLVCFVLSFLCFCIFSVVDFLSLSFRLVESYIVLDRSPDPGSPHSHEMGKFGARTPSSQRFRLSPNYFGPCFTKIVIVCVITVNIVDLKLLKISPLCLYI